MKNTLSRVELSTGRNLPGATEFLRVLPLQPLLLRRLHPLLRRLQLRVLARGAKANPGRIF